MSENILLYYGLIMIVFLTIASITRKKLLKNFKNSESVTKQTRIGVGSLSIISILLALFISPYFLVLSLFIGTALIYYGLTGFCGMAIFLSKMPWNKK
ncbi:MAG TPA: DUF2892 domain-containing protein [Alphaproteobacteria bacterium]|nr:DUF2892 domain-containing protein [Alphaproteobacteria bacterium]